jgi:hypothetical protein
MSSFDIGTIYKFYIQAYNYNGDTVETNSLYVALASLPDKPTNPPTSDPSITDMSTLGIVIELLDFSMNGGSEITLYDIQVDDGDRGDFRSFF